MARAEERERVTTARHGTLQSEARDLARQLDEARAGLPVARRRADEATAQSGAAADALRAADDALRAAERQQHRLEERAESLARRVDDEHNDTALEAVAESPGVLGVLADLVTVDEGWTAAFEAAVGPALGAVVVTGTDPARVVLARPAAS